MLDIGIGTPQAELLDRPCFRLGLISCCPGIQTSCFDFQVRGLPGAEASGPPMVANSMRVHPSSGDSYLVEFPAVESPAEDIVHLSELMIHDFIGPQLLQFLGLSSRFMGECRVVFMGNLCYFMNYKN